MEEDPQQKHCCKFCKKKFPCGRSLGGHMRSHMTAINSAETDKNLRRRKEASVSGGSTSSSYIGLEASGQVGYGLRENPKKTWRLSDPSNGVPKLDKICKECGKGFQSWKALFGHMRCHAERLPQTFEEDSWSGGSQKVVMDSLSDNENAPRRRRSRRSRYAASPSLSVANASSSVSEIDQEPEDVAICLMMLSRDMGSWVRINSVAESSDNNGLVKGITEKGDADLDSAGDELTKNMKKPRDKQQESTDSVIGNARFRRKRSEFGVSRVTRNIKSDASDDEFERGDEFEKSNMDVSDMEFMGGETGFELSDEEFGNGTGKKNRTEGYDIELGKDSAKRSQQNCSVTELGKGSSKEVRSNRVEAELGKYSSSEKGRYVSYDTELGRDSYKKIRYDASDNELGKDLHKRSKYECTTCNKTFHSYQALGGHRASHKKVKGCFASKLESSETSVETNVSPSMTGENKLKSSRTETIIKREEVGETSNGQKKIKGHECPICFRVFASGQALGGHKRSHLVGNSDSRTETCRTIIIQKQLPEISELLDLNLPAPTEEDNNTGLKSWWVGSNHEHEPLVGLISN